MKLQNTIFIFCLLLPVFLQAQNQHKIDSLQTILNNNPNDRQRVDALLGIAETYRIHNNDTAIQYGKKALVLSRKIKYKEGEATAQVVIGWSNLNKDNYTEVIKRLKSAVKIFKETNNQKNLVRSYRGIAYAYGGQSNYPEAIKSFYEAKKCAEILGEHLIVESIDKQIASMLEEGGTVLEEDGTASERIEKHKQALEDCIKNKDEECLYAAYGDLANGYLELNNYQEALKYRLLSFEEAKKKNNNYLISNELFSLGRIYKGKKNYPKALLYFSKTLKISQKQNFKILEIDAQNEKGEILLLLGKNEEAQDYFIRSMVIAQEIGNSYRLSSIYRSLSQIDSIQGNLTASLHNFKLHIKYRDSIHNNENTKKILREEFKYESEKIAAVKKVEQENRDKTMLAIVVFVILLLLFLFNIFKNKSQKRKLITQVKEQTKEINKQKDELQELDLAKSRLYTNITHEFRTPLTVISGVTEQLKEDNLVENKVIIQRNSDQLLNLVNQMLDLRKIESGEISIHKKQGDIIKFVRYLTESLKSYAELKELTLHFLADKKSLLMDFDAEKITRIHSNLLSNAIKFTPKGGDIYVQLDADESNLSTYLIMKIKDTGVGISEKQLPLIFERFYQADNSSTRKGEGTGIGLTLVLALTKAMDGTIIVNSIEGEGTTFIIKLPITNIAKIEDNTNFENTSNVSMIDIVTPTLTNKVLASVNQTSEKPTALIVEDNADVIHYLINCLKESYTIEIAMNGEEGIIKAIENIPDIIVSDVMMPIKDGFELCQTLKTDERTSHIPIILLTAKADIESRLEGLQRGADAYLSKPFHQEELLIILQTQLELRKKLQARFSQFLKQPLPDEITSAITENEIEIDFETEDAFLLKIKMIIEKDLSNSEIGMIQLVRSLGMSRSQIFKKVKALTGQSPSIYINSIRLIQAKKMLKTTDYNVSEIAYKVGFTSPAYFSKLFLALFGTSPNETRK